MKLPNMKYADTIIKGQQIKFGGLNHNSGAGDGELWDMKNLTSDYYPLLASRPQRRKYGTLTDPGGLFALDELCWVGGTGFYFNGVEKGQVTAGEKTMGSMGAYVLIFPDKKYYNVETDTFGTLEAAFSGSNVTFQDGLLYNEPAVANCIYCAGVDWSNYFRAGDGVTISGCITHPENNLSIIIRQIDGDKLYFYEHSFTLEEDGAGYTEAGTVTIRRQVPDLEHMVENENRLWGCADRTIYACKPGDVFNWFVYDDLDTDAYTLTPESPGPFTGCAVYGGYPIFFKENQILKVYGSFPSNFEVLAGATLGLVPGAGRSLAVAGEVLFYLSRNGVMAYTGGIPQPMSTAFGLKKFKNAVGGSDGLKYYVSMQDEEDRWGLYVYDTQRGVWHKEDDLEVTHFARWGGGLYMLSRQGDVWVAGGQELPEDLETEPPVEWMAEFSDFTADDPNKKAVSKLQIRLELDPGATAQIYLMFSSDGIWRNVGGTLGQTEKRSYYLPIVPRRGDHYRLKITGTGGCRVYSLTREYYIGSALRRH